MSSVKRLDSVNSMEDLQDELFVMELCLEMIRKHPEDQLDWLRKCETALSHCHFLAANLRQPVSSDASATKH